MSLDKGAGHARAPQPRAGKSMLIDPRKAPGRFFIVASLMGILIATLTIVGMHHYSSRSHQVSLGERNSLAWSRILSHTLSEMYLPLLGNGRATVQDSMAATEARLALNQTVQAHLAQSDVKLVRIHDRQGKVVYSSAGADNQMMKHAPDGHLQSALGGQVISAVMSHGENYFGMTKSMDMLETYVPIHGGGGETGGIIGAFEIYTDFTDMFRQERLQSVIVAATVFVIMTLLYVALLLMYRRADRLLHLGTEKLSYRVSELETKRQNLEERAGEHTQEISIVNAALRQSEEKFRAIAQSARDAIILMDEHGNVAYWNPAGENLFGYSAAEAMGAPVHDLIAPEKYRGDFRNGFIKYRESGEGAIVGRTMEFQAQRQDGAEFPAELSISQIRMDEAWWTVGIVRDISDRRAGEAQAKRDMETQRTLAMVLEVSLDTVPLERKLSRILDHILELPWLAVLSKGAIFLTDDQQTLKMVAHKGLSEAILQQCASLPFGKCLCGRAAESKQIIYSAKMDARHEITYPEIQDHGHYCIPILSGENELLGVLNTYVARGHQRNPEDESFLCMIAATIASIVTLQKANDAHAEGEAQLRSRAV